MNLESKIKIAVEELLGEKLKSIVSVSGGCIADSKIITTETGNNYFLKINPGFPDDMFPKEANGLRELKSAGVIRVPEVIFASDDFILLEHIHPAQMKKSFFEEFGRNFARLHNKTTNAFGFFEDNYIGSNVQKNIPLKNQKDNWAEFYFNRRLLFQYKLAEKNGYAANELLEGIVFLENKIVPILSCSEEKPALLHGDLWSGNFIVDEKGGACLIDPAVYYGHREADLAMTKLFGGFSLDFYSAYQEEYPLKNGWQYRENIYKLYHMLNHLNLFGMSYYRQAINLINFYKM